MNPGADAAQITNLQRTGPLGDYWILSSVTTPDLETSWNTQSLPRH